MSKHRYLVTSAPPTPNGELHIGHLAGPYLAADVFTRYKRLKNEEILYISYSDDYQEYVERTAAEQKFLSIDHVSTENATKIIKTFELGNMNPDYFFIPKYHKKTHYKIMQSIFQDLLNKNLLELRKVPVYYCEKCKKKYFEAFARGECRNCGNLSDATYCENCCFPQPPAGLKNAFCTQCNQPLTIKETERYFFQISKLKPKLIEYLNNRSWRQEIIDLCYSIIEQTDLDTPITRPTYLGVPVPIEDKQEQLLDTWYGGASGYISATIEYFKQKGQEEQWKTFWLDPKTKWIAFLGSDCTHSHAILYPAELMSTDKYILPDTIITNKFYQLDNKKISTSRRHAIWGSDILKKIPADIVRLYLCYTCPEREESNFSMKEFKHLAQTILAKIWNRWLKKLLQVAHQVGEFSLQIDELQLIHPQSKKLIQQLQENVKHMEYFLDERYFSLQQAAQTILTIADTASNHFVVLQQTGFNNQADLALNLKAAYTLAILAGPIMPDFSFKLLHCLGLDPQRIIWEHLYHTNQTIRPTLAKDPFFPSIQNEVFDSLYLQKEGTK
ncbi:class I tRNA ligase family protein [Thermoactinomyces sp. CICC 10521]|uniref:class I tRNA ligase family protein n=1 Tax=Thermoactinomyces sp. CICC 10521 TaxID=2767426 RepID=UPI0018DBF31A|nr:class I tRNA ligase family protein [Thermoactinomyces sp. CICC 10521]MBH8608760.1 class I tRNA ligase family protein [Thermoactinomyces sp. CICC 10521]